MIHLNFSATGEALGRDLANEPEDAAEALWSLASTISRGELSELQGHIGDALGAKADYEVEELASFATAILKALGRAP